MVNTGVCVCAPFCTMIPAECVNMCECQKKTTAHLLNISEFSLCGIIATLATYFTAQLLLATAANTTSLSLPLGLGCWGNV